MSQDTFPFADDEANGFAEEGESSNRKAVFVAGGVAAALVLGVGGWLLLGGSGDDSAAVAFVPSTTHRPAIAAPKAAAQPAKKLPAAYKARLGRDPFKALYVVPAAAPAGGGTSTESTPTTTGTTTTGTTGTSTTATGTTTPAGTTRYTLKLVSMSTPKPGEARFYNWLVAGAKKTVIPAQRFGKFGEVVVLASEIDNAGKTVGAIIQVGDDSPIDVKVGESVSIL